MKAQHVVSDEPEVIAIVQANQEGRRNALERINAWAVAHGAEEWRISSWFGRVGLAGCHMPTKPTGWVNGPQGSYLPGKKNRDRAGFAALQWTPQPVPGVSDQFEAVGHDGRGSTLLLWPHPWIWAGRAWASLSEFPGLRGEWGDQWSEVRASEAMYAREQYNDSVKAAAA